MSAWILVSTLIMAGRGHNQIHCQGSHLGRLLEEVSSPCVASPSAWLMIAGTRLLALFLLRVSTKRLRQ
jgi:hypothetical protein